MLDRGTIRKQDWIRGKSYRRDTRSNLADQALAKHWDTIRDRLKVIQR